MTGKPDDQQVVLIEKQAVDWRTAPGVDDGLDLTDLQRQPWKVTVLDGAYGGLDIIATAPDGNAKYPFLFPLPPTTALHTCTQAPSRSASMYTSRL